MLRVDEPFRPLVVGLVRQAGAPPAEAFAADLARESVDIRRVSGADEPPPAELHAILVWLPRGAAREVYADLIAWRARADRLPDPDVVVTVRGIGFRLAD